MFEFRSDRKLYRIDNGKAEEVQWDTNTAIEVELAFRKRLETAIARCRKFTWSWAFAGEDVNSALKVLAYPDLILGTDAKDNVIRIVDFTHTKNFAVVRYNDERAGMTLTGTLDVPDGITALENFTDVALHGRARLTAQATALFDRFWDATLAFKPLELEGGDTHQETKSDSDTA